MTKQEILDLIREVAAVHHRAPGKELFYRETGIRESAWSGRYWARWSEALEEAGLRPNKLGYDVIADELVLCRYAQLMRALGRTPTKAELQLERRRDRSFPSHNVFARFGSKEQLLAAVRQLCSRNPGYEDVLSLLPQAAIDPAAPISRVAANGQDGSVYLLKAGRHYKIGRTNSTGRREYELAIQLPEKATKVHEIRTDDPAGIEAYWHRRFEAKRANGEWFALDRGDVAAFRRRKFM